MVNDVKDTHIKRIDFYHLTISSVTDALAPLLSHTLKARMRAIICCSDLKLCQALDKTLWEDKKYIWLPHGLGQEDASLQPIWLTVEDDFLKLDKLPNQASFLFSIYGAGYDKRSLFERSFYIFESKDQSILEKARLAWKESKKENIKMNYWKHEKTGWQKIR